MSVVVVGASVGGVRVIQALRAQGFEGPITLLGDEPHFPYDKPQLSKEMLYPGTVDEPEPVISQEKLQNLDVELRLGLRASELDPEKRVVTTDNGETFTYNKLVIATGVTPRHLPGCGSLGGVHTLRTAEDVSRLRPQLRPGRHAVVIGAGFIGSEFAAAAQAHDVEVTMIEAQQSPQAHILGPQVGTFLADLHEINGVSMLTGAQFDHFRGADHVTGVVLSDGQVCPADLVVVGIGAYPTTDWLSSSGLPIPDGIDCDESLKVIGFPDVYAAGDVARRWHPFYDERLRIEHWTNANDHAAIIAADLLDTPRPKPTLPYVWSDQHGKRIQIVGRPDLGSLAIFRGDHKTGELVAGYADPQGVLVGALVINDPRLLMKFRKSIVKGMRADEFEHRMTTFS